MNFTKTLNLLVLFIISISSDAQNYKVIYERINYKEYENGNHRICPTVLYVNSDKSIFFEDKIYEGKSTEVSLEDYRNQRRIGNKAKGDSLGQIVMKTIPTTGFKQRKRSVNSKEFVYVNVVDSLLPSFEWEIENEYKEILTYKSQKATTKYKGRNITAWFTNEFGLSDGPWKFWNLPGLILEVNIDLDTKKGTSMVYEAVSIESVKEIPKIQFNPELPRANLDQIEKEYRAVFEKQFKYLRTRTSGGIETRVDDLDFEPIIFTTLK